MGDENCNDTILTEKLSEESIPSCFNCELPMDVLYSSSCKHLTMCFNCGKKLAEERSQCYECGTRITRLIQEYTVRLASPNDKSYSIAKFPLGLPNFESSIWSLEKEEEASETLKLKDESGLFVYTGDIAVPGSQYYILIPRSNEIVAIRACSWYNFQKVPRGQPSLEDFEDRNVEIKRTSAPLRFMIDAAAAPFFEAASPFGRWRG